MGDLRVRLLGGLEVEGLAPAALGSRKARLLLAVLAAADGAARSPEALVEIVWADGPPTRAADQLGVLVSRLRRVLGADRLVRRDAGFVLLVDWLDVGELGRLANRAADRLHADDVLGARLAATMGLDLARGPLLPEHDGPWVDGPRAAVERALARLHLVAADAALRAGDPRGAAATAAAALDRDPYDEAALRLLMRAQAEAGRPASALAAYAAARALLAEDLGVSPTAETEAVHDAVLAATGEPGRPEAGRGPAVVPEADRWDPLVLRARAELAASNFDAAWRDADEAVRRGGGPVALELAGWVAYYRRDYGAARALAEQAADAAAVEERRASSLTLAGRVHHSQGDLERAAAQLEEAAACWVPGVRAVAEVWLGAVRNHQGRPVEALELVARGATDAAAMRHPFVIPHAMFGRVYALGQLGRVAEAWEALAEWEQAVDLLGPAGDRYRAAAQNFRAWLAGATGALEDADRASREALAGSRPGQEAWSHAVLDVASLALDRGDAAAAGDWLARVQVAADHEGTMVWHQRQRHGLLTARHALLAGRPEVAAASARDVRDDAAARGARRMHWQAEVVVLAATAAVGGPLDRTAAEAALAALDEVAVPEAWRATAELARAGAPELWPAAGRRARALAARCGTEAGRVQAWLDGELARLLS